MQTIETPDPTSREFERYFSELLWEAMSAANRRLVLVVDNLDRVPLADAQRLWASLRVFCEQLNRRDAWSRKVWLLVSYDREAIGQIFDPMDGDEVNGESAATARKVRPHNVPAAFLDKTFQVRFDVPLLILTDWKDYLYTLLQDAIPGADDMQERYEVYRVSAILAEELQRPPTPRHLKLFVNDIGAIVRQIPVGQAPPLGHIACYAVLRRRGLSVEDIRAGLLDGDLPGSAYEELLGDEIRLSLAMLVFGTSDPEKARELLFRAPVLTAVAGGDAESLRKLAARRDFWPLAEFLLDEVCEHVARSAQTAMNASRAVQGADLINAEYAGAKLIVRRFVRRLVDTANWNVLNPQVGETIASLIRLAANKGVSRRAIERISDLTIMFEGTPSITDELDPAAEAWAEGLSLALEAATEVGHETDVADVIMLRGDADKCARVLSGLASRESRTSHYWPAIATAGSPMPILEVLVPQNGDVPWQNWKYDGVRVLARTALNQNWGAFMQACRTVLTASSNLQSETAAKIVRVLPLCAKSAAAVVETVRRTMVETGCMHHNAIVAGNAGKDALVAEFLVEITTFSSPLTAVPSFGRSHEGRKWLQQLLGGAAENARIARAFAEVILRRGDPRPLERLIDEAQTCGPFVSATIVEILQQGPLATVLSPRKFVSVWDTVRKVCQSAPQRTSFTDVVKAMSQSAEFMVEMTKCSLDERSYGLACTLVEAGGLADDASRVWLVGELSNQSGEQWAGCIERGGGLVDLAEAACRVMPELTLGPSLADGLKNIAIRITSSTTESVSNISSRTGMLLNLLDGTQRTVLGSDLVDVMTNRSGGVSESFFEVFGPFMIGVVSQEDATVLRRTIRPLVENGPLSGCKWAATILETKPAIISAAPKADRKDFRDRLAKALKGATDKNRRSELRRIAKLLG